MKQLPLDDDIRKYLEAQAGVARPSELQLPISQIRQVTHSAWTDVPRPPFEAVTRDFQVQGRDGPIPVRLYRSVEGGVQPLVLFAHGGGFVFGDLNTHHDVSNRLALDGGVQVLAVDYRLAPEHPFPAGVNDFIDVLTWCSENFSILEADPERFFVAGDSAGGNFAAVAAQVAADRGIGLAGQILIYPVTDLRRTEYESRVTRSSGYGLSQADMWWYLGHYLADWSQDSDPLASPIVRESLAGLAPAFVMTAGYDPLHSEGEAYAHRLSADGVPVEHLHLSGANHGVFSNFSQFAAGEQTWVAMLRWLAART